MSNPAACRVVRGGEPTVIMQIEVTQFHSLNGRQTQETAEVSDDCRSGYELMRDCGCRLTAEVLSTGQISCTIEHPEGDFDIEITTNGPDVKIGIERMLKQFTRDKFESWMKTYAA